MFGWLEWLRWQIAKGRFVERIGHVVPQPLLHAKREFLRVAHDGPAAGDGDPANTEPYVRLARFWEDCSGWVGWDYATLLTAAQRRYKCPTQSVLDLACGSGKIARNLARSGRDVVGLDRSQAMILEAEARRSDLGIRFEVGDFRNFTLGAAFDALVCGGDSLNYVTAPEELTQVFRSAAAHARPGGLFVFDALDGHYLSRMSGIRMRVELENEAVEIRFRYDPVRKVSEDRAILGTAIERHRRIPIERIDVLRSAAETGWSVADQFNELDVFDAALTGQRQFYLLRKTAS